MTRSSKHDPTESGVLVYPKMPVPDKRHSEPRLPRPGGGNLATKTLIAIFIGGLVAGTVVGFVLRPMLSPDTRVAALEQAASGAKTLAETSRQRADEAEAKLDETTKANAKLTKQLATSREVQETLATKAAAAAKAADAVQAKLKAAVDKGTGSVSAEGDEIRLQLVDKVLFKLGDDQLTERGKAVLAKVGAALKEIPDKQVWVQGHTDDTPIVIPPPPKRGKKGPPPAPPRFATNWELSAARALTVVHYLQDTAKLEPAKLAALAFGQYRPVSRSRAANRRIEIVLYPYRAVIDRK